MTDVCYKCKSNRIFSGVLTHEVSHWVDADYGNTPGMGSYDYENVKSTLSKGWRKADVREVDGHKMNWGRDFSEPRVSNKEGIRPDLFARCCADCGAVEIMSNLPKLDKDLDAELAEVAETKAEEKEKKKVAKKKSADANKKKKQKEVEKLEKKMNKLKKELEDS